jgi:hypothetical protein
VGFRGTGFIDSWYYVMDNCLQKLRSKRWLATMATCDSCTGYIAAVVGKGNDELEHVHASVDAIGSGWIWFPCFQYTAWYRYSRLSITCDGGKGTAFISTGKVQLILCRCSWEQGFVSVAVAENRQIMMKLALPKPG